MLAAHYRYELRHGDEIVATGYIRFDQPLECGQQIEIAGRAGLVQSVEPVLGTHELRLVVQLSH